VDPVTAAGNIFAADPDGRTAFIEENEIHIFDPDEHEVLFVLGCQGSYSPEARPVVVATARLLEAAGVKYGVLEEETCWGEGVLHGGGIMEDWPFYKMEKVEELSAALDEKHDRTILTICPHCKDNIGVQLSAAAESMEKERFANVVSHISFLLGLAKDGKLSIAPEADEMTVHHPCKTIHNDETAAFDDLLKIAGVTGKTAGNSPDIPRCCGGGGGGFLWDSPAKVAKNRFTQLMEEAKSKTVVTGCPGCHRMLSVVKDEDAKLEDIATVLHSRLQAK
jgi:Fe-S oxidoreductase